MTRHTDQQDNKVYKCKVCGRQFRFVRGFNQNRELCYAHSEEEGQGR